jgi:hypothetical protein
MRPFQQQCQRRNQTRLGEETQSSPAILIVIIAVKAVMKRRARVIGALLKAITRLSKVTYADCSLT